MRVTLTIAVFLLVTLQSLGQQLEVKFSQKQLDKLEAIQDPARKLRKYKRIYHREDLRQARELERKLNRKYDSLGGVLARHKDHFRSLQDSLAVPPEFDSIKQWIGAVPSLVPKTIGPAEDLVKGFQQGDEMTRSVLEQSGGLEKWSLPGTEKISEMIPDNPLGQDLQTLPQELSLQGQSVLPESGEFLKDIGQYQTLPSDYNDRLQQVGERIPDPRQFADSAYVKEQLKKQLEEKFMNFLESNPGVINSIQTKAALLMKKYSIVPNSNDLSTAVKRTSLEGKPLGQRVVLGLNFQFLSVSPISFDFSPALGYRINTKWVMGLSGSYRFSSPSIDSLYTSISNTIGIRAFSRYEVARDIYAYVEYGQYIRRVKTEGGSNPSGWESSFILGACKRLPVHRRLDMIILMGYNFLHRDSTLNPSPFVVRVGIESNQFAFMKRK